MTTTNRAKSLQLSLSRIRRYCKGIGIALMVIAVLMAMLSLASMVLIIAAGSEDMAAILYSLLRDGSVIAVTVLASRLFLESADESTPFGSTQTRRLREMTLLLLFLVVVELCFDVDHLSTVTLWGMNWDFTVVSRHTLDIPVLVMAAIAFCMSVIFQYGSLLQSDHDGTV